jgi:S-adenosylmethionine hydrolase
MPSGILTLTTDFGRDGPYVAAMKGVVLGLAPGTQFVDVSHGIAPQNVLEGAFVLAGLIDVFPEGTVHLGVIDPGVGTERHLVAVEVDGHWFVVPDNGLMSGVLRTRRAGEIRRITNPAIKRPVVSNTFHGRDILAPAAAHLLRGGDPAELGPRQERLITLANFEPRQAENGLVGEVIFRDAFGNLVTSVPADRLPPPPAEDWTIEIAGATIRGLRATYGEQPTGTLIALAGSTGWIEVAVVNGDAARHLMVGPGTTVLFRKT